MKRFFAVMIATWFGAGFIPRIPKITTQGFAGTYGSLAALPLCYGALLFARNFGEQGSWLAYCGVAFVIFALGALSLKPAMEWLGTWVLIHRRRSQKTFHDQYEIVIDEVFGMLVSCAPLYFFPEVGWWWGLSIALVLFRFFDGTKLWPISLLDRRKNASSVMWDDGLAGLMAAICVAIVFNIFF